MLTVNVEEQIATLSLNRPDKANAINAQMLLELKTALVDLQNNAKARVIILNAKGKSFCAGIDFSFLKEILQKYQPGEGRNREALRRFILDFQEAFNAIEACSKPVIAAIQGACIGAGLDMVAACDLRFCTEEAFFSIKEIDLGIVADVGSLQRLPYLINRGVLNELAFTGRNLSGKEAEKLGLVNRCFKNEEEMQSYLSQLSREIASKSPLAIRGVKEMLLYSRDHSVADSLNYAATWNAAMLISSDLTEAYTAAKENREPQFEDS